MYRFTGMRKLGKKLYGQIFYKIGKKWYYINIEVGVK